VSYSVPRDTVDIDARVGGHQRFVMVSDEDPTTTSPVDAVFLEVVGNELLVGAEEWEGVSGSQPPVDRFMMRIEFHDEGDPTRIAVAGSVHARGRGQGTRRLGELVHQVGQAARRMIRARAYVARRTAARRLPPRAQVR
jgi:uncharacterized protein YndB with AHSA1/START domain